MKMIGALLKNLRQDISDWGGMYASGLKKPMSDWMQDMGMESMQISEVQFNFSDKKAARNLYVELVASIQGLEDGDEQSALDSIYSLFGSTRKIAKDHGMRCASFSHIAFMILNKKIRPFTGKWHKISLQEGFKDKFVCQNFRTELSALREDLLVYAEMLADMSGVHNLAKLDVPHANKEHQHA